MGNVSYNIDFEKIDTQGEELGRIIAMKMVGVCPQLLARLAEMSDEEDESDAMAVKGTITAIDEDIFVVFSLEDEMGKVSKFYWFGFIESDIELTGKYKSLKGKTVRVTALPQEFFDSRIGEYRVFNVIQAIDVFE